MNFQVWPMTGGSYLGDNDPTVRDLAFIPTVTLSLCGALWSHYTSLGLSFLAEKQIGCNNLRFH